MGCSLFFNDLATTGWKKKLPCSSGSNCAIPQQWGLFMSMRMGQHASKHRDACRCRVAECAPAHPIKNNDPRSARQAGLLVTQVIRINIRCALTSSCSERLASIPQHSSDACDGPRRPFFCLSERAMSVIQNCSCVAPVNLGNRVLMCTKNCPP